MAAGYAPRNVLSKGAKKEMAPTSAFERGRGLAVGLTMWLRLIRTALGQGAIVVEHK
jgi:hypothetical protein